MSGGEAHMPRVEAGEAERINLPGGYYILFDPYRTEISAICNSLGERIGSIDAASARAFAATLNPAPAPQDTAEAMAEVERTFRAMWTHVDTNAFVQQAQFDHLVALRALADRATTAEAKTRQQRHRAQDAEAQVLALEAALARVRAEREVPNLRPGLEEALHAVTKGNYGVTGLAISDLLRTLISAQKEPRHG